MIRRCVGLLVVLVGLPLALRAQAADCTYDRCALRVRVTLFSDQVVRGTEGAVVARLSGFAPFIDVLASAGDSVRHHYQAFRTAHNTGSAIGIAGAVVGVIAVVNMTRDSNAGLTARTGTWVLFGAGLTLGLAGGITIRAGRNHLNQSIWHYNRALAGRAP